MLSNDLGIESPDASSNPLHDHTTQTHAFGYLEDFRNEDNRLSFVVGLSNEQFEIPNKLRHAAGRSWRRHGTAPLRRTASSFSTRHPVRETDLQTTAGERAICLPEQ